MNDELPFDDAQSAAEDDKRLPVTAFLLGAGFIGGLLCGLVMLASGSKSADEPKVASKFITPERVSHAAQVAVAEPSEVETEPANDDGVDGSESERERLLAELETLKLKQEVAELQQRLNQLNTSAVSTETPPVVAQTPSGSTDAVSNGPHGQTTLGFWNRMNDVIEQEGAMRSTPQGGISASNAADFLNARVQAAEFAVEALGQLNTSGVDRRALEVAEALTAWYEQGRKVAETGRDLLTQSPETRQGSAGKRYQADEKAYSQAVNKVNSLGEHVRQQLSHEYGISFPALK